MNLGRLSVNQPILAMVLSIVLVIVGAIAYTALPVSEFPEVAPPTVVVTASYPGASAETSGAGAAKPRAATSRSISACTCSSAVGTCGSSMKP